MDNNIIHEALVYENHILATQTQHGPKITFADIPGLSGSGYSWCIVCRCWVHPERLTVNDRLVSQLAANIALIEQNGH